MKHAEIEHEDEDKIRQNVTTPVIMTREFDNRLLREMNVIRYSDLHWDFADLISILKQYK